MILARCFGKTAALVLIAGLCAAPVAALAAPKGGSPDPNAASYVDLNKVLQAYRKTGAFSKFQERLRDKSAQFGEEMKLLSDVRYLSDAERKEAVAIQAKPDATPAEKARLEALKKKSAAIDTELASLSQKASPSAAEVTRLKELNTLRGQAVQMLSREEGERQQTLRQMDMDLSAEVEGDLLKLVEKVAKDQKLPIIYERRAVLFGGNDLTDLVLKKLPK
jgi:Skp family chaperone for outer membrane proteins